MTEKTVSLITFCCDIKYKIDFLEDRYRIKSKYNDANVFVDENEFYSVLEEISDMTSTQFKEYATKRKGMNELY